MRQKSIPWYGQHQLHHNKWGDLVLSRIWLHLLPKVIVGVGFLYSWLLSFPLSSSTTQMNHQWWLVSVSWYLSLILSIRLSFPSLSIKYKGWGMESYVNVKKEIKIFICEISEISLVIENRNEYTWLNENVMIIFSCEGINPKNNCRVEKESH